MASVSCKQPAANVSAVRPVNSVHWLQRHNAVLVVTQGQRCGLQESGQALKAQLQAACWPPARPPHAGCQADAWLPSVLVQAHCVRLQRPPGRPVRHRAPRPPALFGGPTGPMGCPGALSAFVAALCLLTATETGAPVLPSRGCLCSRTLRVPTLVSSHTRCVHGMSGRAHAEAQPRPHVNILTQGGQTTKHIQASTAKAAYPGCYDTLLRAQ